MHWHYTSFFQQLENVLSSYDASNISFKGYAIDLLQSLIILTDKLSQPCDFFGSRFFIVAPISISLISKDKIYFFVFRQRGDKELSFSREVHWEAKNLLNKLVFSELSLSNNGGIRGVLLLFTKRLIVFQYVLGSVEGSLSVWPSCIMYFSFASEIVGTKTNSFLPHLKIFLSSFHTFFQCISYGISHQRMLSIVTLYHFVMKFFKHPFSMSTTFIDRFSLE